MEEKTFKYSNAEIVAILKEVLAAMEVKEVNKFRIRAYQNAIASIDNITLSVYDYWQNNRLAEIPGVGATLAQHLNDLFTKGKVKDFEAVKKDLPAGMFALIGVRGIGAKKAFKLALAFKLTNRETAYEQLKKVATEGKISSLEGFGEKSELDILKALEEQKTHKREKQRMLFTYAKEVSERVITFIKQSEFVIDAVALGSIRRKEATVGDLDIAISTKNPAEVLAHFLKFSEIEDILSSGDKKATVVLNNDVQVDVRVSAPAAYGSMIQYFTGSKQHNVLLRTYALEMGFSLSEYGIKVDDKLENIKSEKQFYNRIGLPYIEPELRQGKAEIDYAKNNKLPKLVTLKDIKGDFHTHTDFSDGTNTLKEMVEAASKYGYKYYGISDHSPSITSRGYRAVMNIIDTQKKDIGQLSYSYKDFSLFFGYEVNILNNADLALPNEVLAKLDYVVASIHTSFNQSKDEITHRLVTALKNPYVSILGHPSGRLINQREACEVDWNAVFDAAVKYNKIIEINSQPQRLDLTDDLVYEAIKKGVKLIISTDAHSTESLNYMEFGVNVARRGWAETKNIVNTLPLKEFEQVVLNKYRIKK